MKSRDPYDRDEVLAACANHAWQRRAEELKKHGIKDEIELREHIGHVIERQDTRAFRCQPQPDRGQTFPREVYSAPLHTDASVKAYEINVVLNPNRDANGQVRGGTCVITEARRSKFEQLARAEHKATGEQPRPVVGGREALREQERHQQIAKVQTQQADRHKQQAQEDRKPRLERDAKEREQLALTQGRTVETQPARKLSFFEDGPAKKPDAPVAEKEKKAGLQFYEDGPAKKPDAPATEKEKKGGLQFYEDQNPTQDPNIKR
jgi:hypothetical protein